MCPPPPKHCPSRWSIADSFEFSSITQCKNLQLICFLASTSIRLFQCMCVRLFESFHFVFTLTFAKSLTTHDSPTHQLHLVSSSLLLMLLNTCGQPHCFTTKSVCVRVLFLTSSVTLNAKPYCVWSPSLFLHFTSSLCCVLRHLYSTLQSTLISISKISHWQCIKSSCPCAIVVSVCPAKCLYIRATKRNPRTFTCSHRLKNCCH